MEQVTPIRLTDGSKENRQAFRKIGFALVMLTVIWMGLEIAAATIIQLLAPELLQNQIVYYAVSYVPLYFIAMPIYALLMRRVEKCAPEKKRLGFGNTIGAFAICIFVMYIGNFIGLGLMEFIGAKTGIDAQNPLNDLITNTNPYITFVIVVICAPIFEELIFRKILIDRASRYGEGIAVIMSGLVFGLYHMNFYQFFYAFLLGIVFAYVYVRTGRIRYSIGFHMVINFLGSIVSSYILEHLDLEALDNISTMSQEATSQIMQMLPALLIFIGYMLFIMLFMFIGFIVLIVFAGQGKLKFRNREIIIPWGKKFSTVYLNVWMILLIAYCCYMFAQNILIFA